MNSGPPRHVPLSVVEEYLERGVDGTIVVDGSPTAFLDVQPSRSLLSVTVPAVGSPAQVVDYEKVSFEEYERDGARVHRLSLRVDGNADEVYGLLCSILDRVQLSGEDLGSATRAALDSLEGILALRRGLSAERRVGFFGELLTLLALTAAFGGAAALQAWRGPLGEEHDFGLIGADLEVKTTRSERREHWISSATQLAPTTQRPLFLLSIQITTAGLGPGWDLPGLVRQVREGLAGNAQAVEELLVRSGYRDRDADLYQERWRLRTPPAFYEVDENFPSLTRSVLDSTTAAAQRITDVRYRIDLHGLPGAPELFTFDVQPEEAAG